MLQKTFSKIFLLQLSLCLAALAAPQVGMSGTSAVSTGLAQQQSPIPTADPTGDETSPSADPTDDSETSPLPVSTGDEGIGPVSPASNSTVPVTSTTNSTIPMASDDMTTGDTTPDDTTPDDTSSSYSTSAMPNSTTPSNTTTSPTLNQNGTASAASSSNSARMQVLQSMYGFGGFVYSLNACPSAETMASDFSKMKSAGARMVITFDPCGDDSGNIYDDVLSAAVSAGVYVIPLAWTLVDSGTFESESLPRVNAVIQAVIKNPENVIAVAYGDEPLFDNDAGSPETLASYITQMKAEFTKAGIDMPVSISDMAYGWKSAGDISSVASAVDFFMINDFPYFSNDATTGGASTSWNDFVSDLQYFQSIANGKHLMVTQTGWPSNKEEFAPNSANIDASVSSEEGYWKLLDSQCSSFFKPNGISWMWRSWDDHIAGWGVLDSNGSPKFTVQASTSC